MSSLIRRIQRQVVSSAIIVVERNAQGQILSREPAEPRAKFYRGRGKLLGHRNAGDKARLAREGRERKRAAQSGGAA